MLGTSASIRLHESIVIHTRKQSKYISNGLWTPATQKSVDSCRYLNVNKSMNISQASPPNISTKHKIIRNNNP